jgi:hypothetical protein
MNWPAADFHLALHLAGYDCTNLNEHGATIRHRPCHREQQIALRRRPDGTLDYTVPRCGCDGWHEA